MLAAMRGDWSAVCWEVKRLRASTLQRCENPYGWEVGASRKRCRRQYVGLDGSGGGSDGNEVHCLRRLI